MSYPPIEDHGVIGNMRSIALVGMDGTIDFFCYPYFDSPTIFASVLDDEKGGCFSIQPQLDGHRTRQLYLPDTNILLTRFLSLEGVAELTDVMPIDSGGEQRNEMIRTIRVLKGRMTFQMRCQPRFHYASAQHRAEKHAEGIVFTSESTACPPLLLCSTVDMELDGKDAAACFVLNAGESASFILKGVEDPLQKLDMQRVEAHYKETAHFWRQWIGRSKYKGRWREMVNRSALLLKLLISREHGSLIAAATFSLPEEIGGVRNWDYRYAWLRDGAFTLYALIRLGFVEETEAFFDWMRGRLVEDAQRGPLQVMYRLDGGTELEESTLDHLSGYRGSAPVRIGNAAYQQLQLDIYGEMMDSVYLANKYGQGISHEGWEQMKRVLAWLGENWHRPDEGIWEVRGGAKEFLHSRLMCWVAFDRALRLADKRSLSGPLEEWRKHRDDIRTDIFANFWDEELQAFVQYKGSRELDASVMLMPLMRFISPTDPMWLSTMKALEGSLIEDALVHRYSVHDGHIDGVPGGEGSFTACSFWYIECLARSGQLERAQLLFEKMLEYANHLGLYSEELDSSGQHLGNFPQAFTHLALISAATYLDRALSGMDGATWR